MMQLFGYSVGVYGASGLFVLLVTVTKYKLKNFVQFNQCNEKLLTYKLSMPDSCTFSHEQQNKMIFKSCSSN